MKNNTFLIDEYPLLILPRLATLLGLNEAIFLQQLHYWVNKNAESGWVYNTYEDWQTQFPFWSIKTIERIIVSLKDKKIVVKQERKSLDRTNYLTIDYAKFNEFCSKNDKCIRSNLRNDSVKLAEYIAPNLRNVPLTETTIQRLHTETNIKADRTKMGNGDKSELKNLQANTSPNKPKKSSSSEKAFDELIDEYTENKNLREALSDFVKVRVDASKERSRIPFTSIALKLAFKKLNKFAKTDEEKIELVEQAIMRGWRGIFPLSQHQPSKFKTAKERENENWLKTVKNVWNKNNPGNGEGTNEDNDFFL